MRVPWLSTSLNTDCGPACLAMVLSYHGRESSVDEVRDRLGTSRDGTTGLDLVRVAGELGLDARGYRVQDLRAWRDLPLPAIAHYTAGHFVVVEGARAGRSVRVVDPLRGRLELAWDAFTREFSGIVVLLRKGPAFRRARAGTWWTFLRDSLRERWRIVAGLMGLSLLLQAFAFTLPAVVGFVVDRVIPSGSTSTLGLLLMGVPALMAAFTLSAWIRGRGLAVLAARVSRDWIDRIFRHLLHLPLPFYHGRPAQDLIVRVQGVDMVLDDMLEGAVTAFLDSLLSVTALIALWTLYPGLTGLVLAAGVVQGVLTWFAHRRTIDTWVRDILTQARLYTFAADSLEGIADIKMVGADRMVTAWNELLDERIQSGLVRKQRSALWDGLMNAAQTGAPLLVLVAGAGLAIGGKATVGAVVAFYSLAGVALAPISRLAGSAYRFQSSGEYLRRAYEILQASPETAARPERPAPVAALRGGIELRNVSYRFSPVGPNVLEGIDLTVPAGSTVVVVGRTGSGKSTLVKILATLYEPTSGEARVDGLPLDRYDRAALRARIGAVFQENVLVGGSITDNVTLGRKMPAARILRSLAAACLLDDVKRMPLGLATPVGSGGLHLSGGQRQRLCLARAIATRPAILLLDEATSAVDRVTERHVYRRLGRVRCTRIIATHRLYVARSADLIVVLEGGRIVESGTHRDLLARGGVYAGMWSKGRNGAGNAGAGVHS